jgi:putative hemolysin
MIHKTSFTLLMLILIMLSASCSSDQPTTSPTPEANLPNPASVYCEENGGKLELRQDASGGVVGKCIFADGSECDEWAYFRGECKPGDTLVTPVSATTPIVTEPPPIATSKVTDDGWKIYRNAELGYSLDYPADAEIVIDDEPKKSISITGPLADNEYWPQITISHPRDRVEYRPPEGVDLEQWLTDHYLMGDEERMPDVQIAGTTAIHLRHERSPQSYAFDRYFFARAGQLYMITIGHAGDKEDWELYNHFLQSIQFEK